MSKQKEKIVRYILEEIKNLKSKTDWDRANSITDEALEEMVKNDPDDVYLSDEELKNGTWIKARLLSRSGTTNRGAVEYIK